MHVLINDSIAKLVHDKFFVLFKALINFDVSENAFIDRIFAQQNNLELISLKNSIALEIFDESQVVSRSLTHYVYEVFDTDRSH